MIDLALDHEHPTAIRYPKANAVRVRPRTRRRSSWAKSELIRGVADGMIIACGTLLAECVDGGRKAVRGRYRGGRDQRPIRQAAGTPTILQAVANSRLSSRWKKAAWWAGSAAPCWKRRPTPGWTPATSAAWAFPIVSSNMPSARAVGRIGALQSRDIAETVPQLAGRAARAPRGDGGNVAGIDIPREDGPGEFPPHARGTAVPSIHVDCVLPPALPRDASAVIL